MAKIQKVIADQVATKAKDSRDISIPFPTLDELKTKYHSLMKQQRIELIRSLPFDPTQEVVRRHMAYAHQLILQLTKKLFHYHCRYHLLQLSRFLISTDEKHLQKVPSTLYDSILNVLKADWRETYGNDVPTGVLNAVQKDFKTEYNEQASFAPYSHHWFTNAKSIEYFNALVTFFWQCLISPDPIRFVYPSEATYMPLYQDLLNTSQPSGVYCLQVFPCMMCNATILLKADAIWLQQPCT